jgi:hypothetical protein
MVRHHLARMPHDHAPAQHPHLDTNSYSVPWRLIGESVQVVVLGGRVVVRHAGEVVADHALCQGRRQRIVERASGRRGRRCGAGATGAGGHRSTARPVAAAG